MTKQTPQISVTYKQQKIQFHIWKWKSQQKWLKVLLPPEVCICSVLITVI